VLGGGSVPYDLSKICTSTRAVRAGTFVCSDRPAPVTA
jgi:hypothetical protein